MSAKTKLILNLFAIVALAIAIAIVSRNGFAWTNPTSNPPLGGSVIRVSSGNVGIGTTDPAAQLHIADIYAAGGKNLLLGDDAYLSDVDTENTVGIYGNQDSTKGGVLLGSSGPLLSGFEGNLGIGTTTPTARLDVNGGVKASEFCIGSECRSFWWTESQIPTGYKEYDFNFTEDVYPATGTYGYLSDTCNGDRENAYACGASDAKTCRDTYLVSGYEYSEYYYRNITCRLAKTLVRETWNEVTVAGTATITGRDYSGDHEHCNVSFSASGCSFTNKSSPVYSEWTDTACKQWLEEGIQYNNFCPAYTGVTSAVWSLSGDTGPVTIKYTQQ